MPSKSSIGNILFRLTLPGGLLLALAALILRLGLFGDPSSKASLFPIALVAMGLVLSGFFRRSRLFFALLVVALAQGALTGLSPHLSARAAHVLVNAVALLVPLDLLALAFLRERGIVSGRHDRQIAHHAIANHEFRHICSCFDQTEYNERANMRKVGS